LLFQKTAVFLDFWASEAYDPGDLREQSARKNTPFPQNRKITNRPSSLKGFFISNSIHQLKI
jgi:hypothetical protein